MSAFAAIPDRHDTPKRTFAAAAYDRLRYDILHCVLAPGERLRLHQLAGHYGFGVGTIREALSRLVGDGLVEAQEQRGFSVSAVSRDQLLDLLQMRLLLEEHGVRKSIELAGVDWEVGVMSAFHRLSKVSERNPADAWLLDSEFEQYHGAFHHSLLAGCNSLLLLQMRGALYERWKRHRRFYLAYVVGQRDHLGEHRALMEATLQRNADRAVQLLRDHFESTVNSLLVYGMPGTTKNDGGATPNRHGSTTQ